MNYQLELDKIINKIENEKKQAGDCFIAPKLLLHCCCAPCSSYVFQYLSSYFQITAYFYNPNIDTEEENNKREAAFTRLFEEAVYPITFIRGDYKHEDFLEASFSLESEKEGGRRCEQCFKLRLENSARLAKELQIPYFTTTLTISPHKNAIQINQIMTTLGEKFDLLPLPCDFKKKGGYQQSIQLSKEYNLYRQNYCGCEFSKS